MRDRILFLTGRLAESRLEKVLEGMGPTPFDWSIFNVGVKVAALMTEPILMRRLPRPLNADRVIVPGRCRADLARLTQEFGSPFQRGPDEVKDLPAFFGRAGAALDLSAPCAQNLRRDRRCFADQPRGDYRPLRTVARRGRRRHRYRLPARHAFPPSRGCGAGIEGERICGQRRFGCARGASTRRRRGRRLSSQPHRAQSRHRRRDWRAAGVDPGPAWRSRFALSGRRTSRKAGSQGHSRSRHRSHPFRLRRVALALSRRARVACPTRKC